MSIEHNNQFLHQVKPNQCPSCGAKTIADYVYGLADDQKTQKAHQEGRIVLGGCDMGHICAGEPYRAWRCMGCGGDFYSHVLMNWL
ncbi:hypothetical protein GCM10009092_37910 [Bowmanella denitrificans]|uniref:Uncharacterized protein n=1 Tax=Bowmanella denitrificans TaxID=366582 RepID=A0ABN0XQE5_9ALTE